MVVALKAADQQPDLFTSMVLFGPRRPPARTRNWRCSRPSGLPGCVSGDGGCSSTASFLLEKTDVPQWMIDLILATDIEPYIVWSEARTGWNWNAWDAMPNIR